MTLRRLAALQVTIGALVLAAGALGAADDSELERLAADVHASEVLFEAAREDLDAEVRLYTRPLFRSLTDALDRQVDAPSEHAAIAEVRRVLAAPGPAWSVAKHLHEVTRQTGAEGIQALRRAQADIEALIER